MQDRKHYLKSLLLKHQQCTIDVWFEDVNTEVRLTKFINDVDTVNQDKLSAHKVRKLRGKTYVGNIKDVTKPYIYKELTLHDDSDENTLMLF